VLNLTNRVEPSINALSVQQSFEPGAYYDSGRRTFNKPVKDIIKHRLLPPCKNNILYYTISCATLKGLNQAVTMTTLNPHFVTDSNGTRLSVLLPIDEYERLITRIEDLEDQREARETPSPTKAGSAAILSREHDSPEEKTPVVAESPSRWKTIAERVHQDTRHPGGWSEPLKQDMRTFRESFHFRHDE
jgi:hypothetical protein